MSQWYYSKNNQQQGPVSPEQLKQLAVSGQLQPSDLVWKEGMSQRVEGRKIKGLFPAATVTPSPQSPPNIPQAGAVPQQWYYVHAGQRQGPVSTDQIKQLLASGQLQPSDLIWKEGMSQWTAASTMKELLPAPAMPSPQVPPSVPTVSNIPSIPATAVTADQPPLLGQPTAAPALWNPGAVGSWSFLFTWAFGGFLLARNWKSLGDPARATRCMIWFCSIFLWTLLALFTPDTQAWCGAFRGGGLVIYLIFCWLEVYPQGKFVKERFNDQYPRKSWKKPIACGVSGWVVFIILAAGIENAGVSGGSKGSQPSSGQQQVRITATDPKVDLVKNGHLSVNPNISIGKAVDGFMGNPRWESGTAQDGKEFVNVRGSIRYMEKEVEALLQFRITDRTAGAFEVRALEFNGVPQNHVTQIALIQKMYEGSRSAVGTTTVGQPPASDGHEDTRTGTTKPDSVYSQVAVGMTKAQVDAILGPGEESSTADFGNNVEYTAINYKTQKYDITISYHDGQVSSKVRVPRLD
jgi:hypothetical protein